MNGIETFSCLPLVGGQCKLSVSPMGRRSGAVRRDNARKRLLCCAREPMGWVMLRRACIITGNLDLQTERGRCRFSQGSEKWRRRAREGGEMAVCLNGGA